MDIENSAAPDSVRTITAGATVDGNLATGQNVVPDVQSPDRMQVEQTPQDVTMQDATDAPMSPPLTHALEALLGGLESIAPTSVHTPVQTAVSEVAPVEQAEIEDQTPAVVEHTQTVLDTPATTEEHNHVSVPAPVVRSIPTQNSIPHIAIPGLFLAQATALPASKVAENASSVAIEVIAPAADQEPVVKTVAPIEAVATLVSQDDALTTAVIPNDLTAEVDSHMTGEDATVEGEHPEWEADSSPIESSSDDSSDDSSSEESEDGDNTYKLLSPEEQAKILMEGDGGSDDEGGGKAKGAGGQLRTKNEVPEIVVPKPDVTITADMPITELGGVEHIVDNILLIRAKTSGEYRVLEVGSVLCLGDRSVIGAVAETLGRVQQPLYSVMFTNAGEVAQSGLAVGTTVFYSDQHSTYVFTQALKAYKGSDASNLHDEEVGDEEMEFSDDEAEAEHKRRVKQKRNERRGGNAQPNGGPSRGRHPLQQQQTPYDASNGISYDDPEEDGPYKPLSRPAGFENTIGRTEAPQEGAYSGGQDRPTQNRDMFRGRGRAGERGKGDRSRGRGDRGRGRGGFQDRRGGGHSLPPRPSSSQSLGPFAPSQYQPQQQQSASPGFSRPTPTPPPAPNFYMPPPGAFPPGQLQMAWPQFPPQFQQQFQNAQNGWQPPPLPQGSPAPGGAYINPAFLPGAWNPQGGNGNGNTGK